jgi:plasmid maintenance system antidote protein VapI
MMDEAPKVEAVQRAIDASGGKQEILAERLGCAQQTVSKLLRGEIQMTADWALRLASATGIPAPTFYPALGAIVQPERASA